MGPGAILGRPQHPWIPASQARGWWYCSTCGGRVVLCNECELSKMRYRPNPSISLRTGWQAGRAAKTCEMVQSGLGGWSFRWCVCAKGLHHGFMAGPPGGGPVAAATCGWAMDWGGCMPVQWVGSSSRWPPPVAPVALHWAIPFGSATYRCGTRQDWTGKSVAALHPAPAPCALPGLALPCLARSRRSLAGGSLA